jgi:hypothetical protein
MAQIAIEKDLVNNDSEQFLEDVVDHFAQQKNRRIPLVYKTLTNIFSCIRDVSPCAQWT